MASKVSIPERWLQLSPNLKKVPHLYNIDQAVGLNCPNKPEDVVLVRFMLLKWSFTGAGPHDKNFPDPGWGNVPASGTWDLYTLGWILMFQIMNPDRGQMDGRFDPIDFNGLPTQRRFLSWLNVLLLDNVPQLFKDVSTAPGAPGILVQALKK
jgi:hypothetical protein